jgi:dienelactone hydrolase
MKRLVAVAAVAAAVLTGCAVTPTVQWQRSTFEGFEVISYVPDHPKGMVYLFHGTNGSARFADRIETTDVINRLVARGYGFVSTSSTERTGNKRWNVFDPSLTTNPDLARLSRLQAHLVGTTGLEAGTPLVGIGMSNGARFVTLWGQAWRNAGFPVKAIWASHGNTAPSFDEAGQLTVPSVFSTSENDFTVPPGQVILSFSRVRDGGTPSELYVSRERTLNSVQYQRIPGIDPDEAKQIVEALIATGVWNSEGARVEADIEQAAARAASATLPASVRSSSGEIQSETALQLAVHQFTAEYAEPVIAFFGRYVP